MALSHSKYPEGIVERLPVMEVCKLCWPKNCAGGIVVSRIEPDDKRLSDNLTEKDIKKIESDTGFDCICRNVGCDDYDHKGDVDIVLCE